MEMKVSSSGQGTGILTSAHTPLAKARLVSNLQVRGSVFIGLAQLGLCVSECPSLHGSGVGMAPRETYR